MGKMVFPVILAAVCLAAAMGTALGEEGILYMRGESPEGTPQVNRFHFAPDSGTGMDAPSEAIGRAAPGSGDGYVGWRESCFRSPLLVGGWKVDMETPGNFALAPSLVRPDGDFGLLPPGAWGGAVDEPSESQDDTEGGGVLPSP